jgi:hypothetical protein
MLAHEQFPLAQPIELGSAAERAGFDLLATSDHLQPWQASEGPLRLPTIQYRGNCTHRRYPYYMRQQTSENISLLLRA